MCPIWHVMRCLVLFINADFTLSEWLSTFGPQEFIGNLKHLPYSTFVLLIIRKIFACPSGKLSTEFTSPIAKSSTPRLSDMTFFARCIQFASNEGLLHSISSQPKLGHTLICLMLIRSIGSLVNIRKIRSSNWGFNGGLQIK